VVLPSFFSKALTARTVCICVKKVELIIIFNVFWKFETTQVPQLRPQVATFTQMYSTSSLIQSSASGLGIFNDDRDF
jgi:hypothetical protein